MNIKKKPDKLVFVISSLGGGGAERVLVDLISSLDRRKYNVLLVVFEEVTDLQKHLPPYIKVIYLNKRSRWDFFKLIIKLGKILNEFTPTIVISSLYHTNIVTGLASFLQKRKSVLILWEHNYPPKYLPKVKLNKIVRLLMQLTYNKADTIVTVSNKIRDYFSEEFKIDPKNIQTIYNPIIIKTLIEKSKEEVEHLFFGENNTKIIISVGRLTEQKRFDLLLKAFSLVRKNNEDVRLIILGKGFLRKDLENLAKELNIHKWVDLVGFKVNPYAWMAKADIFVLCSDYEGFPVVLLEAMECGVPIISTDCLTGPNEIITNNKNGLLIPTGNEDALSNAILSLLKDEKLRQEFSENGRHRAKDFDIEKITPKFEELFNQKPH
jgi:glycosyltransferase involved in cell wall biosynthesis